MTNNLITALQRQVAILKKRTERFTWHRVEDRMPEYCTPVIVYIPEEDDHITSGMWDNSHQWVLLDDGRVPECKITHWMYGPEIPGKKLKQVKNGNL